jgi:hypothetical protein
VTAVTDTATVTSEHRHPGSGITSTGVTCDGDAPASSTVTAGTDATVTPQPNRHRDAVTVSPSHARRPAMTVTTPTTVTRRKPVTPTVTVIDVEPTSVTDRRIPPPRQGLRGDMSLDQFLTYYVITLAASGTAGYGLFQYLT